MLDDHPKEAQELKRALLERGLKVISNFPLSAPVILSGKRGGICMVIDWRVLNKVAINDVQPIRRIR